MRKDWKKWGLSLTMGLLAALLVGRYWDQREKKWLARMDTTSVWVMRKDVPTGKRIGLECVELRSIPKIYAEPGALSSSTRESFFGSSSTVRARIGLKTGEQLTKSKFTDQEARLGLSWTLPADQTAISVKLSREDAVAGFIQPGDWVSVFGTLDKPTLVLKQARVLAVQDQMLETESEDSLKGRFPSDTAILLTLCVRREDAILLARALEHGHVTVALLPAIDEGSSVL